MMKLLKIRASFAVFLLFFGISLLEAFRTRNWLNVAFWLAVAITFLIADNLKEDRNVQKKESE
ncbi:MAG TPA: hypothetical protein VFP87_13550 [Chitinophagaceae bacterium]|nr:hypothetical protein [Chitinophagaceae bacterium]